MEEEEECVERQRDRDREKREAGRTSREQGPWRLRQGQGMEEPDRYFGEGRRLKIQQSAAHCPALSSSLPAMVHGGGGEGEGGITRPGVVSTV